MYFEDLYPLSTCAASIGSHIHVKSARTPRVKFFRAYAYVSAVPFRGPPELKKNAYYLSMGIESKMCQKCVIRFRLLPVGSREDASGWLADWQTLYWKIIFVLWHMPDGCLAYRHIKRRAFTSRQVVAVVR